MWPHGLSESAVPVSGSRRGGRENILCLNRSSRNKIFWGRGLRHDVEGLCNQFPSRLRDLRDRQGDALKK